jgi:hypothetical protein
LTKSLLAAGGELASCSFAAGERYAGGMSRRPNSLGVPYEMKTVVEVEGAGEADDSEEGVGGGDGGAKAKERGVCRSGISFQSYGCPSSHLKTSSFLLKETRSVVTSLSLTSGAACCCCCCL